MVSMRIFDNWVDKCKSSGEVFREKILQNWKLRNFPNKVSIQI